MFGMVVGRFCSFVMGIFNPYVVNKAAPDWMWGLTGGSAALYWMLQS